MKPNKVFFVVALALLAFLVYLPALKTELIWDARPLIRENTLLQGNFSLAAPFQSGYWATTSQRTSGYDYYRPLMILSFMAEKAVWGLSPFRLALLNLVFFIAGLIVLYLLLRRQAAGPGIAETAVLLFALFPPNLDNICWVAGRCDVLMFLFGMLALFFFDLFLEKRTVRNGSLALAAFLLALFSKEAALFFLPFFILLELSRRRRLTVPLHASLLAGAILFWLLKSSVIGRGGIPVHFSPALWENCRSLLGALGYYFRTLLFPFRYDMFLSMDDVRTLPYLVSGFAFLLLLAALPWWGRKRPQYAYAWIWIAPFMAGYLLMVFTPIYPFSISSRYLMIPAIGWVWLLGHWLAKLPATARKIVVFMLVFISALAVVVNSQKYRSERDFWKNTLRSSPHESFFLNKYAGQLLQDGDFLGGETLLHRALSAKMKNSTAISIALQLSEVDFEKARYPESLDWLEKIRALPMDLPQANRRLGQLLKIRLALGDLAGAETAVQEMIKTSPTEQNKIARVGLDLAFAAWEKARESALALAGPQAREWLGRVRSEELAFASLSPGRQSMYFLQRGNYALAWKLWPQDDRPGVAGRLQTARLAFLAGSGEEGQKRIARLAREAGADFRVLNSIGNLFFDLHRSDQALTFYRRSLQMNPGQPALRERVRLLAQFAEQMILLKK